MKPVTEVESCHESHRRLLEDLAPLTDADFRSPSLLPGYTRAHVVTHIANKARAHVRLFGGPPAGEIRVLHPDGYDPDVAASAGTTRNADALRDDLETALTDLEVAWEELDENSWSRQGIMTAGPRSMAEVVAHHLRNIEVHHVDLDIGYRASDWPAVFLDGELGRRLASLRGRTDDAQLLLWLLDRGPAPELSPW